MKRVLVSIDIGLVLKLAQVALFIFPSWLGFEFDSLLAVGCVDKALGSSSRTGTHLRRLAFVINPVSNVSGVSFADYVLVNVLFIC